MTSTGIFSTRSMDRQLIELAIELKSKILALGQDRHEILNDDYFAKIYEKAQNWDKVFKDSLSPRKGE